MLDSVYFEDEDGNSVDIIRFTYDEKGIRTSKTYEGVTTYYTTVDGVITSQYELDADGNVTNQMLFLYDSYGNLLGFTYNGKTYFYLTNHMGDVIGITDDSGNLLEKYYYDAWGECILASDCEILFDEAYADIRNLSYINPMRYRGYYCDEDLGAYYLQSRYYMSTYSRFLNADLPEYAKVQKDDPAGTNLFAYCNNDPVNNSDPTGLITPANIIGAIICGVLGAVGGYFFTRWLADRLNLTGWKRKVFIAGLTALITASAAAIGYFVGPYVAKAWSYIGARLTGLVRNSFKGISKITTAKMKHINVSKHLWNKVLGRNVTNTNIQTLIFKAVRNGNWSINSKGVIEILWSYKGRIIVVTGKVLNGILKIGDAWVKR